MPRYPSPPPGTTMLGIDPGRHMGIARVEVGPTITVHGCVTVKSLAEFSKLFCELGHLCPPAAIEWWEPFVNTPERLRGLPHQAEAAGRAAGFFDACEHPYITITRTEILASLNLPRSSDKRLVRQQVRVLTRGVRPRNDHEADAVAAAIAGAARWEIRQREGREAR
ncbi:MAG: hypothetical protein Q8Q14_09985 [Gemmatimonadales bacterium]|nr:hypothetical protein [Gemmatimonadales bacterium]